MESNPSQGPCFYSSRVCPSTLPFLHDDDNFYFPETFFRAALNGVTEKPLSFTHKSRRQCLHSNTFQGLPCQRRGGEKGSKAGAKDKQMQDERPSYQKLHKNIQLGEDVSGKPAQNHYVWEQYSGLAKRREKQFICLVFTFYYISLVMYPLKKLVLQRFHFVSSDTSGDHCPK